MLSKEEQTKRSARRKRFGVTEVANRLPVQKLGKVDMLEQMRWPKGDEELRRDILHVYGVDLLDTDDIRTIFFGYGVKWVEWINDSSCNVAFEDDFTVKRILKFMNDESTILKKGSDGEDEDGKESKGEDTEMKDEDDVVDDGRKQGVDENEESASVVNKGSIGTAVTKEWSSMTCGDLSPSNSAGSELVPRGSIHSDFSPSENSALLSPAVSAAVSSGTASAPTGVAQGRFEHVFPLDEALEWKQIVPTRVRGEFYQFYMRMATSVDERPARPNPESKWSVNVLAAQRGKRDTGLLAKALKQSSRMRSSS